jgi:predicted nucleotidyltransferase
MRNISQEKRVIIADLVHSLRDEPEIRKIILFGSFLTSDVPRDLDVAIIQDSQDSYLPLALKYRRKLRGISRIIPLDVVPVRQGATGAFMTEIEGGDVVYES